MANPAMIGGGRLTRGEVSGDRRQFRATNISKGALLLRFWRYLGKNRGLILLAFGVLQLGLSLKSHDPSQRANGMLTIAGGIVITFTKEILTLITG